MTTISIDHLTKRFSYFVGSNCDFLFCIFVLVAMVASFMSVSRSIQSRTYQMLDSAFEMPVSEEKFSRLNDQEKALMLKNAKRREVIK